MQNFTKEEKRLFKKLNTPSKIQDYLDSFPFNFEEDGHDTIKSPINSVRVGRIHCLEGAILGAYLLSLHGHDPFVLHLQATRNDFDHVIAPFRVGGLWGALSKTNHYTLRYRDPVYKSIRELVMSYFHEYFLNKNGFKTLYAYSNPFNLSKLKFDWVCSQEDLWVVDEALDLIKHFEIINKKDLKKMRLADPIERRAGNLVDYHPKNPKFKDPNLSE